MDYDIAIIGAGPAGLSFALSLRETGLKIVIIEKQSQEQLANPANDGREIALTHWSRHLMQQHGSWQRIAPDQISPLLRAEVIDGNSPYTLSFDAPVKQSEPLGFLVSNCLIRKAIYEEVANCSDITLMELTEVKQLHTDEHAAYLKLDSCQQLQVRLIVSADSRFSNSRRQMGIASDSHDFGRGAILCRMQHERSHHHTAQECFLFGGTMAVLPMNGAQCSVVITVDSSEAERLLTLSDSAFTDYVEQRLNGRLGKMQQVGERHYYPLVGVHANRFYANRFVLIGDAAVGMHPVTAHGFNLGLSGQDLLATEVRKALNDASDFWQASVLQRYQQKHMLHTCVLYHGTNRIVELFTDERLPARLMRKAVLRFSNHCLPVKWAIRHKLMNKNHPLKIIAWTLGLSLEQ